MNSIYNSSSPIKFKLAALALLICTIVCFTTRGADAGKGKVPIYMPIPIPIPMPMGPSPGKQHHHHQQQHGGDGEGEVKKIYLLQPVGKAQPQPQLKGGGFMGPAQTHIHLPSPVVQHPHSKPGRQAPRATHTYDSETDGGGGGVRGYQQQHTDSSGKHHSPDVKILPIVVIPPIAPMPPIQIQPPASTGQHTSRMTLSPHFNNYLVTTASDHQQLDHLQDHKTFADYGSLGAGASGHRGRMVRSRPARLLGADYGRQASSRMRLRGVASYGSSSEDSWGDELELGGGQPTAAASWRRSANGGGGHTLHHHQQQRLRSRRRPTRMSSNTINSIRDILDQQALFDDEPTMDGADYGGGSGVGDSYGSASHKSECCANEPIMSTRQVLRSHRHHQRPAAASTMHTADSLDNFMANSSPEQWGTSMDQHHSTGSDPMSRSHSQAGGSSMAAGDDRNFDDEILSPGNGARSSRGRNADLNSVYYDRDSSSSSSLTSLAEQESRQRLLSGSGLDSNGGGGNSRRLTGGLDEREIFEDDEWRFETIKSVAHVSPGSGNETTTTSNTTALVSNQPSTTTIPPPLPMKKSTKAASL